MVQQKHDKRQAQVFFDFIVAINGINLEPKALIFVGRIPMENFVETLPKQFKLHTERNPAPGILLKLC